MGGNQGAEDCVDAQVFGGFPFPLPCLPPCSFFFLLFLCFFFYMLGVLQGAREAAMEGWLTTVSCLQCAIFVFLPEGHALSAPSVNW